MLLSSPANRLLILPLCMRLKLLRRSLYLTEISIWILDGMWCRRLFSGTPPFKKIFLSSLVFCLNALFHGFGSAVRGYCFAAIVVSLLQRSRRHSARVYIPFPTRSTLFKVPIDFTKLLRLWKTSLKPENSKIIKNGWIFNISALNSLLCYNLKLSDNASHWQNRSKPEDEEG